MRIELHERFTSTEELRDCLQLEYRKGRKEFNRALAWLALAIAVCFYCWARWRSGVWAGCAICFSVWATFLAWVRFCRIPFVVPRERLKFLAALGEIVTVLDDAGIHERNDAGEVSVRWDAVTGCLEDNNLFLILFAGGRGKSIPKRLLTDDELRWLTETLRGCKGRGAK